MKKTVFTILIILLGVNGFSQTSNDNLINEVSTNKMTALGMSASPQYTFQIYNDSLVMNYVGGMGYKSAVKKGLPLKIVHKIKCKTELLGSIIIYLYQNDEISIKITLDNKKVNVLHRTKDSFSDNINEIVYYNGL